MQESHRYVSLVEVKMKSVPLDEKISLDFSLYWPAVRNKEMTIRTILFAVFRYGKGEQDLKKLPQHIQAKIERAKTPESKT